MSSGENIFKLIADEMENAEIPWENCLSLGCDNAAVMVGKNKGVFGYMKVGVYKTLYNNKSMYSCLCSVLSALLIKH